MTEPVRFDWTVPADEALVGHLVLPDHPRTLFGRARMSVVVAVGGHRFRSTTMTMGGVSFVPFNRANRTAAGAVAGGVLSVVLTPDREERTVELPPELAAALAEAGVRGGWDALSFTARREAVEGIAAARRPETRAKRVAAAVEAARTRA